MSIPAKRPAKRIDTRRGVSTVDLLVGLVALALVTVAITTYVVEDQRRSIAIQAAQHVRAVATLASQYRQANLAALDGAAASGPVAVPIGDILAGDPFGVAAASPIAGQSLCVVARRRAVGDVAMLVISRDGDPVSAKDLGSIQTAGGFWVGLIDPDTGAIVGPRGSWTVPPTQFATPSCAPSQGRFVFAVDGAGVAGAASGGPGSTAMNRFRVDQRPELTTMFDHVTLAASCDDPTTAATETTAPCEIRPAALAASEPGLSGPGVRLLNALRGGNFPATYNSGNLNVAGQLYANAFYYTSDPAAKAGIRPVDPGRVADLSTIRAIEFDWVDGGRHSIGLDASKVAVAYPELVDRNPATGRLAVNYGGLISLLIERSNRQQAQLADLRRQLLLVASPSACLAGPSSCAVGPCGGPGQVGCDLRSGCPAGQQICATPGSAAATCYDPATKSCWGGLVCGPAERVCSTVDGPRCMNPYLQVCVNGLLRPRF